MHLKRLELRGFKSFAKSIEIQFQPGINVIVGPNGCGKSNIADAIRWVLGEANVRNLRGQRGEDVIFTGTDKKKPLGMAAVSMTLDNQDYIIGSDYSEINITRRIYRSGESEFMINLSEVRLKDIHSLFAGTGLGKRGYSIIGQGELEQVLDAKPFERRLIMEEAAALSGHRQKKDEAEAKLQTSAQDLIRLEDILGEVSQRVTELEEKALRARGFLRLNSELGFLERRILAYDIYLYDRELKTRERDLQGLTDQLIELQKLHDNEEQAFKELAAYLMGLRENATSLKEKKYQLATSLNRQETEARLSRERVNNARERLAQMETDMDKSRETLDKLEVDLDISVQELALKEEELKEKSREAEAILDEIKMVEDDWTRSGDELELFKTQLIDLLSLESSLKNQAGNKEERLRKNREKLEISRTENLYRSQRIEMWQETLTALEDDLAEGERILQGLHLEKNRFEAEKERIVKEVGESEARITSLQTGVRELNNQALTLEEGLRSHVGLSEGVRRLITAVRSDRQLIPGFLGVVTDLLEVPPGLEVAVEAAAGRSLENVVVKDHQDAQAAIKLLKSRSWGRVTFLPLKILRNPSIDRRQLEAVKTIPGVLGLASELVRFAPEYRKAAEHVLGRVLIVENLDIGLEVFRKNSSFRIVTVEGDIINPTGAMTGGKYQGRAASPLQMKAAYREKKKEMETRNGQLKTAVSILEELKAKLQQMEAQTTGLQQQISERAFQQDILRKEQERVTSDLEQGKSDTAQFRSEETIITREGASLESELSEITVRMIEVQSNLAMTEGKLEERRSGMDRLSRQLDLLRERHAHCCDLVNLRQRELDGRRQSLQQLSAVKTSYDNTMLDYQQQIKKFTETVEVETERIKSFDTDKKAITQELSDTEELIKDLDREVTSGQKRSLVLQEAVVSWRQQIIDLEEKTKNLEIKKARAETEEKNACLLWEERFAGESFAELWEGMDNRQQREMREKCLEIKQAIEELGPVDVTAIDELEDVNQRYNFLQGQIEDLHKARHSLTRLIEETETIMNSRFQDFLALANASFKNTFNSIFKGGDAELLMENHENSWQSGVDIMVKMPGKRRQSLNLLSGGERALTCIAFIFSLLVLKPTPFCLLDEIDSALDDANLGRFSEFLKRLGDRMQFIVITHRQGTIEVGENIFGVTMPEQGMSEVYSLTSSEAEALAG